AEGQTLLDYGFAKLSTMTVAVAHPGFSAVSAGSFVTPGSSLSPGSSGASTRASISTGLRYGGWEQPFLRAFTRQSGANLSFSTHLQGQTLIEWNFAATS